MKKTIITTVGLIMLFVVTFFGTINHIVKEAEAEEEIIYTVHVVQNVDNGYIPKHDFEMSKASLKANIKLCWWEASWLDSGDLLIGFDADEETWFVKLQGNDPTIKDIIGMTKVYSLKCSIPER